jgi:hypothetical protein
MSNLSLAVEVKKRECSITVRHLRRIHQYAFHQTDLFYQSYLIIKLLLQNLPVMFQFFNHDL